MAIVCRYPGKICPNDRQGALQISAKKCVGCYWKREESGAGLQPTQVLYCMDCSFWCGRCVEPSMQGKRSVGRVASSDACEKFKP